MDIGLQQCLVGRGRGGASAIVTAVRHSSNRGVGGEGGGVLLVPTYSTAGKDCLPYCAIQSTMSLMKILKKTGLRTCTSRPPLLKESS